MFISGIYALNKEINTTESGISTGTVDIEIKEYNNNAQPFDLDGTVVMPGDEIVLIPRVNNLGLDCYIRTKIEYFINNEDFSVADYIEGNYSSWTKKGDYYYYDSIFFEKSSIDLFNKVTIPNLSSEYNDKKIIVSILVEAVQAKNFDGNWDNVDIRRSINRSYDIYYEGESSVIYEDGSSRHITFDDAFFNKLGNILPGDSISEDIYTLGKYKKSEGDTFKIEVSLPSDANNDYSKLYTKIKWKFSYKSSDGEISPNPKTGDFEIDIYIIVFILSAIGLIIDMFLWKRENKIIEKKEIKL